ncbi:efflux RND transporter permease subunit [Paenibacillus oenotherae]|uniref:Efflux RND transporter permease subunit n=1 Tax=Paenibacillus oenotherae TaxID=1435645 RepID=A0ABS7D7C0_9BACL|nr:efflux RND transporter permease subunit [Paenibacillus oenotherae]MBW7475422.1 efflux RND transporter permease subunit [Paenibacillus oenotherae]
MRPIIRFSMKNTAAILLIIIVLIGGGLYAAGNMKMEMYPDVDIPYMHVTIVYPGASPEQSMRDIGEPLEKAIANIDGVNNIYTWGKPNRFQAVLKTNMSANMEDIEQEVRNAIAKTKLPDTAREPIISSEKMDPEVYEVAFYAPDQEQLQHFVEETVIPAVRSVEGVDTVETSGVLDKRVYVRVKPESLAKYGLTLDMVQQLITANNISVPIGDLRTGEQILPLRISETLQSIEDIESIRLSAKPAPGQAERAPQLKLGDIAEVVHESVTTNVTRLNGKPAISVMVLSKGGEDVVAMVEEIKEQLGGLNYPPDMKREELHDQSVEVEKSVYSMLREVLIGACMAVLVTLLFLRNFRSTVIAVISIPLSMFASFIVLQYLGYTLNMMTLAGIAVAIGRVVDDSIVVIENIFRRVRSAQNRDGELVEHATHEVASAITSSTLTTVAVFLPLAFVPGIVGKFFVPLAWTIVVSLLFSLLVAVTVVPLMSRLFLLKLKHAEPQENGVQRLYRRVLRWALGHRLATLAIAILLLLGSASIPAAGLIGFNFLPSEKATTFNVTIGMPIGSTASNTDKVAAKLEEEIKSYPEVIQIVASASNETGRVSFKVEEDADTKRIVDGLQKKFANVSGAKSITIVGTGGIGGSNLSIIVNGTSRDSIAQGAEQITQALQKIEGLANIRSSAEGEKPEVVIGFDPDKLAEHALTPAQVAMSLRTMVEGNTITQADINNKPTDVILQLDTGNTASVELLKKQSILNGQGQAVALQELGEVKEMRNSTQVARLDQKEYLEVYATITDENTSKVSSQVFSTIDSLKLPEGVTWSNEGAAKEMNEGFINMGIALLISIVLVYFVMLLAFGEALLPLVILAAIPFSIIGAITGLYLVGEPIGMPAMIGLLMLNGIVVTNAIVLLDRVKRNERRGMEKGEALLEAGATRLRPILMTAIATIGALMPLALSAEAGLVSRALAVVVIGGLTSSTLLTLVIVPVIYHLLLPARKQKGIEQQTHAA